MPLESVAVVLEDTLTLVCQLNRPKGDVVWRHSGIEIKTGGRYNISADGVKHILTVTAVSQEDEGEYSCESKDDKTSAKVTTKGDLQFNIVIFAVIKCKVIIESNSQFDVVISAPRLVRFTSKLNNIVAVENTEAIFKCSITPADVTVRWLSNDVPLSAGPKYKIAHGGTSHSLTITNVCQGDAGEISVDAEGKFSKATLQVQRKFIYSEFIDSAQSHFVILHIS